MQSDIDKFVAEARAFMKKHKMPHTTFSRKFAGNPNYFKRLSNGSDTLCGILYEVRRKMKSYRKE